MERTLAAIGLAFVLAAALTAQTPQKPAPVPQQPAFKTGVNFVRVDVYPTVNGKILTDLKQDEFEVLEDGVPQRIETFERVAVRAPGAEVERAEPRSVAESDQAAGDSRNRLFVLFLDSYHTSGDASKTTLTSDVGPGTKTPVRSDTSNSRIGRALVGFLDRLIGPDDLVAVTRPEYPIDSLNFTRRPSSMEDLLLRGGAWQRRPVADDLYERDNLDQVEQVLLSCYVNKPEVLNALISRRRERLVLTALRNLVHRLQTLREERKAILVVSEGWRLFRPDQSLVDQNPVVDRPKPGIVGGQLTIGDRQQDIPFATCNTLRTELAYIDDERDFRDLLEEANRSNASFYPIDPRGLPVFDTAVASAGQSPTASLGLLRGSLDSLQRLAADTDGLAILNSNNFTRNLQRISDDLSSYYLLGYNSTNVKLDGKFRKITVRVKRPGVSVRARPGYNAPTQAEMTAREKAATPRTADEESRGNALSSLGTERADRPFRMTAGYGFETAGEGQALRPALWVIGELDATTARTMEWSGGGEATIIVSGEDGQAVATGHAAIAQAAPRFSVQLFDARLKPGDYLVKVRLQARSGGSDDASGQVRVTVPDVSASTTNLLGQPMLFRRGPYTGVGYQPTADLRFHKAERIRVDLPLGAGADSVEARLLDRKGQTLPIPVTSGQREDGPRRFVTAEVVLAPLAPADYLVEVAVRRGDKTEKVLTAFRIVP